MLLCLFLEDKNLCKCYFAVRLFVLVDWTMFMKHRTVYYLLVDWTMFIICKIMSVEKILQKKVNP